MTMTKSGFLRRLFTLDQDSVEYQELAYKESSLGLGTKPWWNPLTTVWAVRANPYEPGTHHHKDWQDALTLLESLHKQFLTHQTVTRKNVSRRK